MLELNKVYNMDCIEGMKKIDDNSVDLVVTDPPYAVLGINSGYRQEWDIFQSFDEYLKFIKEIFKEIERVSKKNSHIYIFWSQKYLKEGLEIFNPKRVLIWHHPNLAKVTNKMFLWTYDPILYIKKGKPVFNPLFLQKENVDVFNYPKPQSNWKGDNFRFHPTSKPLKLISNFVKISSDENMLVLDPFIGGGTTAVACKQLNRNFIGFEINSQYCEVTNNRLKSMKMNTGVFRQTKL